MVQTGGLGRRGGAFGVRRRRRLSVAIAGFMFLLIAPGAVAHPLGNFTTNRFSALEVALDEITVHYVVDMAEIPTFQELRRIDTDGDGETSEAELEAYSERLGSRLREGITLFADGHEVRLRLIRAAAELRPGQGGLRVLRIEVGFAGPLPSRHSTLVYRDRNFTDPPLLGWKEVIAYATGGQGIRSSSVPNTSVSDALRSYPKDLLQSPPDVDGARVTVAPGADEAAEPSPDAPSVDSPTGAEGSFVALVEGRISPPFLVLAFFLALGVGGLHALGPGHGKTVMAAYLLGGHGRPRDAAAIGIAVSFMHTASVVALGVVTLAASSLFPPEAVYPWLSLAAGVVVLGLGLWLLGTRLVAVVARSRPQGHPHEHPHGSMPHLHDAPTPPHRHDHHSPRIAGGRGGEAVGSPYSWRGLAAVALSGGLLPSPSALVVLLGAVALHRVAFGVLLVAAFSIGLAGTLTLLGVLVLRAKGFASRHLNRRAGALLPIMSAAAIVIVGVFLTTRAIVGL